MGKLSPQLLVKVRPFAGLATELRVTEKPGGGEAGAIFGGKDDRVNPGGGARLGAGGALVLGGLCSSRSAPILSSEHFRSSPVRWALAGIAELEDADCEAGRGLVEFVRPLPFFFLALLPPGLLSSAYTQAPTYFYVVYNKGITACTVTHGVLISMLLSYPFTRFVLSSCFS